MQMENQTGCNENAFASFGRIFDDQMHFPRMVFALNDDA